MSLIAWALFLLVMGALILVDLGVFHRQSREISLRESLLWTVVWIGLAMAFAPVVDWLYQSPVANEVPVDSAASGSAAVMQFLTAYVLEKSLSLDNVFVIALIFAYFGVPLRHQHRLLFWGILGAVVLRGLMIATGALLLHHFEWMIFVFGGLLLVTAIRMLLVEEDELHPDRNALVKLARWFFPVSNDRESGRWFVREAGRWAVTPLFLALILIESSDAMFAVDSIPAVFGVTRDPFIVFTSNIFAILGLRSLYFVLAGAIQALRYLKISLIAVLIFVALKMLLSHAVEISNLMSLVVVGTILGMGWLASAIERWRIARAARPPFDPLAVPWAVRAYRLGRRLLILVVGGTILLIGVAMIVLPGPATVVIPVGLSILALEFMWARRWLDRLHRQLNQWLMRQPQPTGALRESGELESVSAGHGIRSTPRAPWVPVNHLAATSSDQKEISP